MFAFKQINKENSNEEFNSTPQSSERILVREAKLIAVGGGKGGIGKSFFSTNVGIALTEFGYKVALVDLDFGAANLHTCLGIARPNTNLFDYLNNKVENLEDIAVPTGISNMVLLGGGQEFWQQIRPLSAQKIRIISKLQKLDVDFVIMDLAAGTHTTTQDFFIFSHSGIILVVPEPTSIENAYVFLKGVLCRRLETIIKSIRQEESSRELLGSLQDDPKTSKPPYVRLKEFANQNPEVGSRVLELIQKTQIGIVVNQTRNQADIDIGTSMKEICNRYFGFSTDFLGHTSFDDSVWKSVRSRNPLLTAFSNSVIAEDIREIAKNLVKHCGCQIPQAIARTK